MEDVRPLKTYGFYNTDHPFGHFGWAPGAHFFCTAFWTLLFLVFLATFEDSGAKKVSKMDGYSEGKMPLKSTLSPKSSQGGPREAQELQNEAKVLPKGVKMEPQGPQN